MFNDFNHTVGSMRFEPKKKNIIGMETKKENERKKILHIFVGSLKYFQMISSSFSTTQRRYKEFLAMCSAQP